MVTSVALGMAASIRSAISFGMIGDSSPRTSRVGAAIPGQELPAVDGLPRPVALGVEAIEEATLSLRDPLAAEVLEQLGRGHGLGGRSLKLLRAEVEATLGAAGHDVPAGAWPGPPLGQ